VTLGKIHYQTFNGQVVTFDLNNSQLTNEVINILAMSYYEKTGELPTRIYLGPAAYMEYTGMMHTGLPTVEIDGKDCLQIATCAGLTPILSVGDQGPNLVMVAQPKDYARYKLDEVFEEEVLEK